MVGLAGVVTGLCWLLLLRADTPASASDAQLLWHVVAQADALLLLLGGAATLAAMRVRQPNTQTSFCGPLFNPSPHTHTLSLYLSLRGMLHGSTQPTLC